MFVIKILVAGRGRDNLGGVGLDRIALFLWTLMLRPLLCVGPGAGFEGGTGGRKPRLAWVMLGRFGALCCAIVGAVVRCCITALSCIRFDSLASFLAFSSMLRPLNVLPLGRLPNGPDDGSLDFAAGVIDRVFPFGSFRAAPNSVEFCFLVS